MRLVEFLDATRLDEQRLPLVDLTVGDCIDYKNQKSPAHVFLAPDATYVYCWGNGNDFSKIGLNDWSEWIKFSSSKVQRYGISDVRMIGNSFWIGADRGSSTWNPQRNSYSQETGEIAQELLSRGIATPRSKLFIGMPGAVKGEYSIGTVAQAIRRLQVKRPRTLTLYHGTSNDMLDIIQEQGLVPAEMSGNRTWKERTKDHPEYRAGAVYLTASKPSAKYYAEKAVKVARKRGVKGAKPVVFEVIIHARDYKNLRPDDDHLQFIQQANKMNDDDLADLRKMTSAADVHQIKNARGLDPNDWMQSLDYFGQVAYHGAITPDQIKILDLSVTEGAFSSGIAAKRKGDMVELDELYVPPGKRRAGLGRSIYQRWESQLPRDVKYVKLMPVDIGLGEGPADPFWKKMGFSYLYHPSDDPDYEIPPTMVKGVNGNPTPKPVEYKPVMEQYQDEEEEQDFSQLPSMEQAAQHKPEIVKRVQQRYNQWEVDEEGYDEEVGGGGICHLLADIISEVMNDAGFPTWTVSSSHEVHVYCVAQASDGVWEVDIPWCLYEQGGGYTWTKIPDVVFEPDDIVINRLSIDPADIGQYADVNDEGW